LGLEPKYHQLDIDDEASVLKLKDFLKANYGGLNVLVNNAAVCFMGEEDCTLEIAKATTRTNFFNTLRACKTLFPILHPHARVVNMSSCSGHLSFIRGTKKAAMELKQRFSSRSLTEEELCNLVQEFVDSVERGDHGERGWPTLCSPPYTVSKIALNALTEIQQREFDQDPREDLIVNAVHPGFIVTDMTLNQGALTTEEGAVAPTWLALLPENVEEPRGGYVWLNKQIVDWIHGPMPECAAVTILSRLLDAIEFPDTIVY